MSGISTFFSGLKQAIITDEEKALLPELAAAVTAIAASPSLITVQAQGGLLLAKAIAAQPSIAQTAIGELAAELNALAATVVANPGK